VINISPSFGPSRADHYECYRIVHLVYAIIQFCGIVNVMVDNSYCAITRKTHIKKGNNFRPDSTESNKEHGQGLGGSSLVRSTVIAGF